MRKSIRQTIVKRGLLIFALVLGLLFLGFIASTWFPRQNPSAHSSATALTAPAGPYTVALSLAPDPPLTGQFTHLTFQVTEISTGQLVTDAGVEIRGVMQSMDMPMGPLYAGPQKDGTYLTDLRFSMGGPWQLQVTVTRPNASPASAQFEITASVS